MARGQGPINPSVMSPIKRSPSMTLNQVSML